MLSLSGELTVAIRNGLKRSATKLVGKEEELARLEKQLDEAVEQGQISREEADNFINKIKNEGGSTPHSIVRTSDVEKVKAFEELAERYLGKIIENPFEHLPEILPLINHKSIGNEIIQIGGENCGARCDAIIEFLRTGRVKVVEPSGKMTYNALRAKFGGVHFQPLTSPERLKVLVKDEQIVIIHGNWEAIPMRNSRGIIEYSTDGHFFIGVRRG